MWDAPSAIMDAGQFAYRANTQILLAVRVHANKNSAPLPPSAEGRRSCPFARCLLFPNDSESDKRAPRKGQRDCWFITENVATGRAHVLLHLTCCLLATRILPLPSAAHKFSLPVFRSVYRVPSPWQSVTDQARHLRLHVVRARLTSIGSGPRRDGRG